MMKHNCKSIIALFLMLCLLFAGCGVNAPDTNPEQDTTKTSDLADATNAAEDTTAAVEDTEAAASGIGAEEIPDTTKDSQTDPSSSQSQESEPVETTEPEVPETTQAATKPTQGGSSVVKPTIGEEEIE